MTIPHANPDCPSCQGTGWLVRNYRDGRGPYVQIVDCHCVLSAIATKDRQDEKDGDWTR